MEDKYYQMKDVMDKFMISRDMIKYYEKKGLIFPKKAVKLTTKRRRDHAAHSRSGEHQHHPWGL